MTHNISAEEARRLLDADRERASREARLKLAQEFLSSRLSNPEYRDPELADKNTRVHTPFGEFTVAELEGA